MPQVEACGRFFWHPSSLDSQTLLTSSPSVIHDLTLFDCTIPAWRVNTLHRIAVVDVMTGTTNIANLPSQATLHVAATTTIGVTILHPLRIDDDALNRHTPPTRTRPSFASQRPNLAAKTTSRVRSSSNPGYPKARINT